MDRYTNFINSINTKEIEKNITLDKLIELKSTLSDINNIMTLISTRSIATKLSEALKLNDEDKNRLFGAIDSQKPNTNGFDIRIDTPVKVLVEVKCNALIRNGKLDAAQIDAILEDAQKLRLKSPRHTKAGKDIENINDYIKIIAITNIPKHDDSCKTDDDKLISQLTTPTQCKASTSAERQNLMEAKEHLKPLETPINEITDREYVYLTVLSKDDLKKELERILAFKKKQHMRFFKINSPKRRISG